MKRIVFAVLMAGLITGLFLTRSQGSSVAAEVFASTPTPTPTPTATPNPTPRIDDPNEIIKVDTELVNLNVRVIDRNNRPINNVQEKEFKIYEDGNLQQIDFFSRSEVPTNYALVVDNSGSMRQQLDKVVEAGKVFVNTNRPDDDTMIIRFVG